MPWSIVQRDDEWCVVKEGESKPVGCHASRSRALKQQAALYAQEKSTVGSVENGSGLFNVQVTSPPQEQNEEVVAILASVTERLVALTFRQERNEELMGRMVNVLAALNERSDSEREELRAALTAATARPDPEPPIVNITVPEPVVTVNVPEARVQVTTPQPVVNVTIPPAKREIKFERDPMSGQITNAEVVELDG